MWEKVGADGYSVVDPPGSVGETAAVDVDHHRDQRWRLHLMGYSIEICTLGCASLFVRLITSICEHHSRMDLISLPLSSVALQGDIF